MAEIYNLDDARKEEPLPPEVIWVCSCGCSTFELHVGGVVKCSLCEKDVPVGEVQSGGWHTPPVSETTWEGNAPIRQIRAADFSPNFALRVLAKRIMEPNVATAVVLRDEGTIHVWSKAETQEEIEWVERQLERVREILEPGVEESDSK